MTFRWRYLTETGTDASGPDETFADQAEAEAWLSDEWPGLIESEIRSVALLDGDTEIYRMGLDQM